MNLLVKYSKQAYKYLKKLHRPKREQIIFAIENIPNGHIIKLKGYDDLYRLRVNDYRVIYTQDCEIIKVEKIGSRGDVYND
jgi:mRNA interferase RelE/StbE